MPGKHLNDFCLYSSKFCLLLLSLFFSVVAFAEVKGRNIHQILQEGHMAAYSLNSLTHSCFEFCYQHSTQLETNHSELNNHSLFHILDMQILIFLSFSFHPLYTFEFWREIHTQMSLIHDKRMFRIIHKGPKDYL